MTVYAFATTWWGSPGWATQKREELEAWRWRMNYWFDPDRLWLVSSADSSHNPIAGKVEWCDPKTPQSKGYDQIRWCYYLCDLEAMLRLLVSLDGWDLAVNLETDWIIRRLNVPEMLEAFMQSPELVLAPAWCGGLENSFVVWKRQGIEHWLNHRLRQNLIDGGPMPITAEAEMAKIFARHWFNPWPKISTMRQEYNCPSEKMIPDAVARTWPLVGRPSPAIKAEEKL